MGKEIEKNCCTCKYTNVKENMIPCVNCSGTAVCGTVEYATRKFFWEPQNETEEDVWEDFFDDSCAVKVDNVNHPKHYEGSTSLECIEVMLIVFGPKIVSYFCMLNAFKYLWRWKNKNGQEDIKKAKWYCDKFMELNVMLQVSTEHYNTVCQMSKYINKHLPKEIKEGNTWG